MNARPGKPRDPRDEVLELGMLALGGEADAAQLARLDELVRTDDEACRVYVASMLDSAHLRRYGQTPQADFQPPAAETSVERAAASGNRRWPARAVAERVHTNLTVSLLVAGLTITIILLPLAMIPMTHPQRGLPGAVEPAAVAQLRLQVAAVWRDTTAELSPGSDLRQGQVLELVEGAAEISFDRGSVLLIRAPARVVLLSDNAARLEQGEATARVPRLATGFSLVTPSTRIVDLGTRFGVRVPEENLAEVQVFQGRVEATLLSAEGPRARFELDAESAMRFDRARGTAERIEYQPQSFLESLRHYGRRVIDVRNPSFESPALPERSSWQGGFDDWELSDPNGGGRSRFGEEFLTGTPDGRQIAFLHTGTLSQQLDARLEPNTRYELAFTVGNRPGNLQPDYRVELLAGDEPLAAADNPIRPAVGQFRRGAIRYTSGEQPPSGPLRIVLTSLSGLPQGTQNLFDNIRLTAQPVEAEE